jgi:alkylation response protein AidB-like acyl-CoA dehydrogenase
MLDIIRGVDTWETWRADEDLAAIAELVDDLVAAHPAPDSDDDPGIAGFRKLLVAQGLWAVGLPESVGGGGAELRVVALTLARLGRAWPGLALGIAHAHAVGAALGEAETVRAAAEGAAVALVRATGAEPVRVDAADSAPTLVILAADGTAAVVPPAGAKHEAPFARSGLAGAYSHLVRPGAEAAGGAADPGAGRAVLDLLTAAIACGVAAGAVDTAADYVAAREQFGAPLLALPTIAETVFHARAAVTAAFDRVLAVAAAPSPEGAQAALRTAFAAAMPAAVAAVQLHGGYGYLREYPVERAMRDLVSLRAAAAA